MEQIHDLIKRRRSIFPATYTGEDIAEETIWEILEAGNWAPNHRKTEPWRFIVFTEEGRQKLADYLGQQYHENTPQESYSALKHRKKMEKPLRSSHVIAICVALSGEEVIPSWEEEAAVACAVQNMWLTCTAKNLGCYWSTPKSMIGRPEFLELKENEKCLGLFYLGVPKPIALTIPGERQPVKNKTRWIKK